MKKKKIDRSKYIEEQIKVALDMIENGYSDFDIELTNLLLTKETINFYESKD